MGVSYNMRSLPSETMGDCKSKETGERYRTMPANGGEKTVVLEGWIVKTVCIDGDHASFAQRIVDALNREEQE